jgi:hypothetical protein
MPRTIPEILTTANNPIDAIRKACVKNRSDSYQNIVKTLIKVFSPSVSEHLFRDAYENIVASTPFTLAMVAASIFPCFCFSLDLSIALTSSNTTSPACPQKRWELWRDNL